MKGHYLIIVKSLYGLKTSGARWHEALSATLRQHKFLPSKADPDIWMRKNKKSYEYIVVYVDDLLLIGQDAQNVLKVITSVYLVKGKSFPSYHLGGDIRCTKGPNTNHGTTSILSAKTYIKNVCGKIENTGKVTLQTYGSYIPSD